MSQNFIGKTEIQCLHSNLMGTPTKRQVSKRQVSKRLVSKRPVSKRQVYKMSGLQNVRFQNVWFLNVQFSNLIYLLNKKYLYLSFLLITSHYGDIWQKNLKNRK